MLPVKPKKPDTEPTPLGTIVRDAMVESVFTNQKPSFLPQGEVDKLVTRRFIIWAFYKCEESPSLTLPVPVQDVIRYILAKARKIFSIFVYSSLKGAQLYGLMNYIVAYKFHDGNLPFKAHQVREFFPWLPVLEDTRDMRLDREYWSDDRESRFIDDQWNFCAPIFSTCKENHDIVEKSILPFVEKHPGSVAAGAFGEVMKYKIHDSHLDASGLIFPRTNYVAIKKIKLESDQDRSFKILGWEKEVRALWKMRALGQKHIVNFITAFRLGEDEHYLILEWADGGNLRNLWEHFPRVLTAELVKDALGQLLGLSQTLCKVHNPVDETISDQHFRHGDLKPENILRFTDANDSAKLGTLKIGDWGLAKQHNNITQLRTVQTSTPFGTRRYEPPEERSIRGNNLLVSTDTGKPGRRRSRLYDIWAMGCIWLEFLIWLMYGYEELKRFNRCLNQADADTPCFYEIGEDGSAQVHRVALQWMEHIAGDPVCEVGQTALGNLLELIRDRLLVVKLPQNFATSGDMSQSPRARRRSSPSSNASTGGSPPRDLTSPLAVPQVTVTEHDSSPYSAQENPTFSMAVSPPDQVPIAQIQSDKDCRVRAKDLYDGMTDITSDVDTADYWLSGTPRPPPKSTVDGTQDQSSNSIQAGLSMIQGLSLAPTERVSCELQDLIA